MSLIHQVKSLITKELILEWRSRYALNGIVLYVVSTIFVCYLSFKGGIQGPTWNVLFWIILFFASINALVKSFVQEPAGRHLYLYTLASPQAIILSKIIYNCLLMLLLSIIALFFYQVVFSNQVQDLLFYFLAVLLGSISLMAVLSFPVIIPLLILLIKFSKNAMDGLDRSVSYDEIVILLSLNVLVIASSLVLFPYLWRD